MQAPAFVQASAEFARPAPLFSSGKLFATGAPDSNSRKMRRKLVTADWHPAVAS
jgi:hypothetical protein